MSKFPEKHGRGLSNGSEAEPNFGRFTLAELLAAASLAVFCAGALLPGLNTVAARAGQAACRNSLRRLSVSSLLYAADYDGHFPAHGGGPAEWFAVGSFTLLSGRAPGRTGPSGALSSYAAAPEDLACPAGERPVTPYDQEAKDDLSAPFTLESSSLSYAYVPGLVRDRHEPWRVAATDRSWGSHSNYFYSSSVSWHPSGTYDWKYSGSHDLGWRERLNWASNHGHRGRNAVHLDGSALWMEPMYESDDHNHYDRYMLGTPGHIEGADNPEDDVEQLGRHSTASTPRQLQITIREPLNP